MLFVNGNLLVGIAPFFLSICALRLVLKRNLDRKNLMMFGSFKRLHHFLSDFCDLLYRQDWIGLISNCFLFSDQEGCHMLEMDLDLPPKAKDLICCLLKHQIQIVGNNYFDLVRTSWMPDLERAQRWAKFCILCHQFF